MSTAGTASALAIRADGVCKRFGRVEALRGARLHVPRGTVFALIGTNGAGKTTLFSILCGFLRADRGDIDVLGGSPSPEDLRVRLRGRLTALPQDAVLSREMTVREHLEFLAQLQGMTAARARTETERVLELFALHDLGGRRAGALSHGQGKRVGVAQAFLGEPELILLDEPTAGLDPRNAHELRQAIVSERGRRTVVVSSHNLQELEAICDEAAFIERGQTVDGGRVSDLTSQDREVTVFLGLADANSPRLVELPALLAQKLAGAEAQIVPAAAGGRPALRVRFGRAEATASPAQSAPRDPDEAVTELLRLLLAAGVRVSEVQKGKSLEQRYLETTAARPQV
jgi:ABC-type multidrug transport system ATPase subunit